MNKMINGICRVLLLAMLLMAAMMISMVAMISLAVAEEAEADGVMF